MTEIDTLDIDPSATIPFHPIGVVRTPFGTPEGTPIQPPGGAAAEGEIVLFPEYAPGLADLDGFSHLILLYHCHRCGPPPEGLKVTPFLDRTERGLFATRAPSRPNSIGLSIVRLISVDGRRVRIREVDIVDGTPLLDIKPYVPKFDRRDEVRTGWLETRADGTETAADDGRFSAKPGK
jgi:tRNA (adenine37-N6)-methyltransferase